MGSLWNRSGTVERYADDLRASGAKAYFYNGGTTTPISVYRDSGETSAHPHPVVADANGRWPDVFIPYTVSYDARVTSAADVLLTFTQQIPNPNPVDVTTTAPAAQLIQTGMVHAELANTTKSGYVRLNGRTMGNAVSGGTERANADTSDLFAYLWNNLTNAIAPVSAGRGGSAAIDFAANKTITLPDLRGASIVGLDDMGNSAAGLFPAFAFSVGDAVTAGSETGDNSLVLDVTHLPSHTHTGTTSAVTDHSHDVTGTTGTEGTPHQHDTLVSLSGTTGVQSASHNHSYRRTNEDNRAVSSTGANTTANSGAFDSTTGSQSPTDHTHSFSASGTFTSGNESANHTHGMSFNSGIAGGHSHTFTTGSTGSGTTINNLGNVRLVTWYIKL